MKSDTTVAAVESLANDLLEKAMQKMFAGPFVQSMVSNAVQKHYEKQAEQTQRREDVEKTHSEKTQQAEAKEREVEEALGTKKKATKPVQQPTPQEDGADPVQQQTTQEVEVPTKPKGAARKPAAARRKQGATTGKPKKGAATGKPKNKRRQRRTESGSRARKKRAKGQVRGN